MLGTPNGGSFASVQAFRGTYPVVRRIASLDHRHTAEQLAQRVFSGFTSLYHMLPSPGPGCEADLFEPANWPSQGPLPSPERLSAARALRAKLARPDDRFRIVAGTGEETVTAVRLEADDFRYRSTHAGDGTVPLELACLEGVATRFARVAHGDLPQHDAVITAVCDLIDGGTTRQLDAMPAAHDTRVRTMTDRDLRRTLTAKLDWARLSPEERRQFLDRLNEPPEIPPATPSGTPGA